MNERRNARRDDAGRLVSGSIPDVKAAAARSRVEAAGLAIVVVDETMWRVGDCRFFPATGLWVGPGPGQHGYGVGSLINRLKSSQAG